MRRRRRTDSVGRQMIAEAVKRELERRPLVWCNGSDWYGGVQHSREYSTLRDAIWQEIAARIGQTAVRQHNRRAAARAAGVDLLAGKTPGSTLQRMATIRAGLAEAQRQRISSAVRQAWRGLYRAPQSKWAGGDETLSVYLGNPGASSTPHKVWSHNGKWSGLDCSHSIHVPTDWITTVQERGIAVIEGLLTLGVGLIGEDSLARLGELRDGEECLTACWIEQARGLSVRSVYGVLYRRQKASGVWYPWIHAQNLRAARAVYGRQLHAAEAAA